MSMTIQKAQWNTEGESVRLSMPFSKVDVERRIVSGFATLDNIDKQQDIVSLDASMNAFEKFRGNIREMHQPKAVGKMISFKQDKYFDPETKKFYSGVFVSTYISKGAQDTWEKVLDGTLSGFSIGGKMNEWDDAYDAKLDKSVRIIKDYDLVELSLVDTPANQLANVLSIEKVGGVEVLKGDSVNVEIENVFWDDEGGLVLLSENDSEFSPSSGLPMKNIGFVEKADSEKTDMIKFLVDSAKGINTSKITKEASPMTDEQKETVAEAVEDIAVEAEVAPEADAVADAVEEAAEPAADEVVEETAPEAVEEKADSVEATEEAVLKSEDVVSSAVAEIKDGITSAFSDLTLVVKSMNDEIAELKKSLDLVNAKIADAENDFNEFGKRVDAVEADTAFRKSGDLGEIVQDVQMEKSEQSLWGGRFLKTADLFK
jgi:Putative phage serine protease XkdF